MQNHFFTPLPMVTPEIGAADTVTPDVLPLMLLEYTCVVVASALSPE